MWMRAIKKRRMAALAAFVWLFTGWLGCIAVAATAGNGNGTKEIERWTAAIGTIEKAVDQPTVSDQQLAAYPDELEKLKSEIRAFEEAQGPILADARAQYDKLGPAPKDGAPPEAPDVAAERQRISDQIGLIDGLMKKADVLLVRATQLITTTNGKRRERFAATLLKPVPGFYSTSLWRGSLTHAGFHLQRTFNTAEAWLATATENGAGRLLLACALPLIVAFLVWRLLAGLHSAPPADADIDRAFSYRAALAVRDITLMMAPVVASLLTLYFSFTTLLPMSTNGGAAYFANLLLITGSALFMVISMWRSVSPRHKNLAVFARRNRNLRPLLATVFMLVIVWWIDRILVNNETLLFTPYAFSVLRSTIFAVLFFSSWLVLLFIRRWTLRWKHETGAAQTWSYIFIALFVSFGIIAMSLGYVALAHFIGAQLVTTGFILYSMVLLHSTAEYVSQLTSSGADKSGQGGAEQAMSQSLTMISSLLLDIAIVIIGIPLLLLQWGFSWTEIKGWIITAFVGFQVGNLTISLQAILIALGVLAAGLVLTRIVQRWFMKRVRIGRSRETGLRDSLETGIAYGGFILSALAAISYLGINFANLAIVAGALSVGIGFGLQSIFNNFVSGLILLVERPIKVGDFISVGDREGYVKKISVRATEIETVQRRSVIIPNATLITDAVTNWMHADRIGRLDVSVGVSYSSDVPLVRETLVKVGLAHPMVLRSPSPVAHFAGFGDSSLDFQLRVYLRDVSRHVAISSEIRYAIWAAFKEADIEIPFPQRDLHIKDGQIVGTGEDGGS